MTARVIPMRQPEADDLAAWALFYVSLGLKVVPVHVVTGGRCSCGKTAEKTPEHLSPGKHPRTKHGTKDASANPKQVARWWRSWPDSNIGILCAPPLVVLDCDPRDGGTETLAQLAKAHRLPAAPMVSTGGGGLHFYFRDVSGRARKCKLGAGIDLICEGKGYVIGPPSRHPSGARYRWARHHGLVETLGLPLLPASLLDVLDPPKPKPRRSTPPPSPCGNSRYGTKAMEYLVDEVRNAPQGQRHDTLYRAAARAGELIREGHLDAGGAFDALVDAARTAYGAEADDNHIGRTIRDGILAGRKGGAA